MNRIIAAIILLCIMAAANGQTISATQTVNNYTIAQKRLLLTSTAQFINFVTAATLNRDTVMLMAHDIARLPFFLAYDEWFKSNDVQESDSLINAGKIAEAARLLPKLEGERRIQLLLKLGICHLHKPGAHKRDLDTANIYIQQASTLIAEGKHVSWQNACLDIRGEYYYQAGDTTSGNVIFLQIISCGEKEGNMETQGLAYLHLAKLLRNSDSLKLSYLNKSFAIYQKLQMKEKEIECLWNMAAYNLKRDPALMEKNLQQILKLQEEDGFKHVMFAQYMLAYLQMTHAKYVAAVESSHAAFENMKWSGITTLSATFLTRIGVAYTAMGKNDQGLLWFDKALANRTNDTHPYWFLAFYTKASTILQSFKYEEAIAFIDTTWKETPPITNYEKIEILSLKGLCYRLQKKMQLADECFSTILKLSKSYIDDSDDYQDLSAEYFQIGRFYLDIGNV